MAGEWKDVAFGDCAQRVSDVVQPQQVKERTPYIGLEHIVEGGLHLNGQADASEATSAKTRFLRGDVLFGKLRPYFRKVVRPKFDGICSTDIWAVRAKNGVDQGFLFYRMASQEFIDKSIEASTGTRMPRADWGFLSQWEIPLPPLDEQKRIAEILGALDDKIELNRKMNATLEAMARALFQSWFVDFDPVRRNIDRKANSSSQRPSTKSDSTVQAYSDASFSAYDHLFPDEFQDSELGHIPKGWRAGTLGEVVELRTDRVDATPAKDSMRYVSLENMPSKSINLSRFQTGSSVNSSIIAFNKGDILFGSMRPYFHKVGLAFFDGITRTTTFVLRPRKTIFRQFALQHFFSDEVVGHSTTASVGTTIPYVKWDAMESYLITLAPDSLLEVFQRLVEPMVERIAIQGEESNTLSNLRDTLLPKLLSGELLPDEITIL